MSDLKRLAREYLEQGKPSGVYIYGEAGKQLDELQKIHWVHQRVDGTVGCYDPICLQLGYHTLNPPSDEDFWERDEKEPNEPVDKLAICIAASVAAIWLGLALWALIGV